PPVLALRLESRQTWRPRPFVRQSSARGRPAEAGGTGHLFANARRRLHLAADLDPARHPFRAPAPFAVRQSVDGLRLRRTRGASRLARPRSRLPPRLPLARRPGGRILRADHSEDVLRRPGAMGVSPAVAVADLRFAQRRAP